MSTVSRAIMTSLAAASTAVSGFTHTVTNKGLKGPVVAKDDVVLAVTHVEVHPIGDDGPEVFVDSGNDYFKFKVNGGDQEDLGMPLPKGWWQGTIGAALNETREIIMPASEGFTEMDFLADKGLKVTIQVVKIGDKAVDDFATRFPETHKVEEEEMEEPADEGADVEDEKKEE